MSPPHDSDAVLPSLDLDALGQRGNDSADAPADETTADETTADETTKETAKAKAAPQARARDRKSAGPGDVIGGRYIIDGQIGRGGMGRVLRVRHMVLDKAFALKLPRARYATDATERQRFYREARMASSLDHDNICSIVDFGDDPVFGPFMVMELLEGLALKEKLTNDGRCSPKSAADIMVQIAEALRYVHSQGVVHGDIKPDNILLIRTTDRHRFVKLLDFGLARSQSDESDGSIRGTPEYLAPERIRKAPASVASDIYALGILFYELLVGKPPFMGKATDVMRRHLDDEIEPPSELISDSLDERADLIVARATAKNPKDRHANVSAFLYELHAFCDMHGISSRRRSADSSVLVRNAASMAAKVGAEVFEHAPVPLASVTKDGTIRVANRAFLRFLGRRTLTEALRLPQTRLLTLYPDLVRDLKTVATTGQTIKQTFKMGAGDNKAVRVAIVLSSPGSETSGGTVIHVALHPLD